MSSDIGIITNSVVWLQGMCSFRPKQIEINYYSIGPTAVRMRIQMELIRITVSMFCGQTVHQFQKILPLFGLHGSIGSTWYRIRSKILSF